MNIEDEPSRRLWAEVGRLARCLPGKWVLVGGLMVQLHAVERGVLDVRLTGDIDVLGQARPRGALTQIADALEQEGFEMLEQDRDGFAHRFVRDGVIVVVLGPDGLSPPPDLGRGRTAVGIAGGSQALTRSEQVTVVVDGHEFPLRRPTLLGAILIKSRALMKHADPDAQRDDLLRLLSFVDDPRTMATEITNAERRWLRATEGQLRLYELATANVDTLRAARLTYRLLVRD